MLAPMVDARWDLTRTAWWRTGKKIRPSAMTPTVVELNNNARTSKLRSFVSIDIGQPSFHIGSDKLIDLTRDSSFMARRSAHTRILAQVVERP